MHTQIFPMDSVECSDSYGAALNHIVTVKKQLQDQLRELQKKYERSNPVIRFFSPISSVQSKIKRLDKILTELSGIMTRNEFHMNIDVYLEIITYLMTKADFSDLNSVLLTSLDLLQAQKLFDLPIENVIAFEEVLGGSIVLMLENWSSPDWVEMTEYARGHVAPELR